MELEHLRNARSGAEKFLRFTRSKANKIMLDESKAATPNVRSMFHSRSITDPESSNRSELSSPTHMCSEVLYLANSTESLEKHSSILSSDKSKNSGGGKLSNPSVFKHKFGSHNCSLVTTTEYDANRRKVNYPMSMMNSKRKSKKGVEKIMLTIKEDATKSRCVSQIPKDNKIAQEGTEGCGNKDSSYTYETMINTDKNAENAHSFRYKMGSANQLVCKSSTVSIIEKSVQTNSDESLRGKSLPSSPTGKLLKSSRETESPTETENKVQLSLLHFKEDVNFLSGENKTRLTYFKKDNGQALRKSSGPNTTSGAGTAGIQGGGTGQMSNRRVVETAKKISDQIPNKSINKIAIKSSGQNEKSMAGSGQEIGVTESGMAFAVDNISTSSLDLNNNKDKVECSTNCEPYSSKASKHVLQKSSGDQTIPKGDDLNVFEEYGKSLSEQNGKNRMSTTTLSDRYEPIHYQLQILLTKIIF